MNKIHFIFGQVYFDSHILIEPLENKKFSTLLIPFQNDPEVIYCDNYFIQNFGKLKINSSASLFPTYGSKANFSFYIKTDNYYIKIIPIIHLFSYGVANIILSGTYITNDSKLDKHHLEFIGKLRNSFEYGEFVNNICGIKCSLKPNSLRDIVYYIKDCCIKKSYPEFDFEYKYKKYCFFNLIKYNKEMNLKKFEKICSNLLYTSNAKKIPNNRYFDCYDGLWKEYLFIHSNVGVIYDRSDNELYRQSTRRKRSWKIYEVIEYAIIEQFLWNYLVEYNITIQNNMYKENTHAFSLSKLKLKNYQNIIIDLFLFLKGSFNNFDNLMRKIVYMYYGGKDKRKEFIETSKEEIVKGLELVSQKTHPIFSIIDKIFSFF